MNANTSTRKAALSRTFFFGGFCSAVAIGLRLLINVIRIPNFQPVGGLGVVSGAKQPLWIACLWSLAAIAGSDLALGLLRGFPSDHFLFAPFVYTSFVVYVFLGRWIAGRGSCGRLAAASLLGSLQFFLVTNFGSWLLYADRYAPDWAGLLHAYLAGLPFYDRSFPAGYFTPTLVGDLAFTAFFVGLYWALERSVAKVVSETT